MKTLELIGNQALHLQEEENAQLLQIVGQDGLVSLSIRITEQGPVLYIEGSRLSIYAEKSIALDAEELHLHGRKKLRLSSDEIIESEAIQQKHVSNLGNYDIYANDDVVIDGERIMMNV